MDFNKLTRKSQEALSEAQGIAIGNNNQEVDVAHLLLALLRDGEGLIPRMLHQMDVDLQVLWFLTGSLEPCSIRSATAVSST